LKTRLKKRSFNLSSLREVIYSRLGFLRELYTYIERLLGREVKEEYIDLGDFPIPGNLDEAMVIYPYLRDYVESLGRRPRYRVNLEYEMSEEGDIDVIYPVGKGVFIHVVSGSDIGQYIVIEPPRLNPSILEKIELSVASFIDEKTLSNGVDEEEVLIRLFNKAIRRLKLRFPREEERWLLYHFLRDRLGYGFLQSLLQDDWLEDIGVPGAGKIFVFHKIFGPLETSIEVDEELLDAFLRRIAERHGKVLSHDNPIIDIHLADGSRLNVVFGKDISLKGSNFTIRKFSKYPISIAHLIRWNTVSPKAAAYLWMLLETGISAFVCGETASGKTTTLNAIVAFIRPDAKIVSIEETPEVNIFHKNWVREVTRLHTGATVTMFDLVKAALRQRPDYIIIGEIRGEEGRIAFQAIETGHPVLSTMHAGNMGQLFQRLTSYPINVPKTHIDSLNLVIFQARIERGRRFIRRITSINEILGFDAEEGRLNYLPSFIYDFDRDRLDFTGLSFLLEYKVLQARGWGKERLPELYEEMEKRAVILQYLAEKHASYTDVFRTVAEVNRRGVDAVYRRILRGDKPWSE